MRRFVLSLIGLVLLSLWAAAQLPQDPSVRKGTLKNGMTYYIRHNAKEAGLADFYIAQRVGSILEEPRQRGLAHFLEHMAFNGTKHFPGKNGRPGIVPWCESIGVKFGALELRRCGSSLGPSQYSLASTRRQPASSLPRSGHWAPNLGPK